jgi:hypothetical protein
LAFTKLRLTLKFSFKMKSKLDCARLVRVKLLGESMREVGVLLLIFVPLDVIFEWKSTAVFHFPSVLGGWLSWLTPQRFSVFFFTAVAVVMLYLGIKLETEATAELEAKEGDDHDADSDPAL